MSVAQGLYEAGHITYMRTDSTTLSDVAVKDITTKVETDYGVEYSNPKQFKNKKANAQEAHEAIRPTYVQKPNISGVRDEQRLYELIWKRTVASQMADAKLEKTTITIVSSSVKEQHFTANGQVLKFDGFLKLYLGNAAAE